MIPFHPLADIFPLIEGQEFADLVRDIAQHGLREPITLLNGKILDGRNRYRASVEARLLPESLDKLTVTQIKHFKQFVPAGAPEPSEEDLLAFVLSKNLRRRHLDESQRSAIASELKGLPHGGDRSKPSNEGLSLERRAEMFKVGRASVERAELVRERAPEIFKIVKRGEMAVSIAAELAQQPAERQAEILAALPRDASGKLTSDARKALAPIIKEVRAERQIEKKQRRDGREAELGRKLAAEPEKKYGVAIEDFEWDHKPWSRETGMDRHPSNHYPTAADAHTPLEIVARTAERFKCLADTCVLYMWTTIPHEAIAHEVLELRGFKYVTQRVWSKLRNGNGRGPGYWVTGEHEILLIAVRGDVVAPSTAHFRSIFEAPVGEHSAKPDEQYEHAEFHFPSLLKIELNARRHRKGWKAWGWESPSLSENAAGPGNCIVDNQDLPNFRNGSAESVTAGVIG